ncbi:hypothetical protein CAEBREN_04656 [Caenorhabditis brenneri]|uniref:PAN-3 domain-containing protein n=1 Tax=Caenorhabditis brenneri TaxID=135651 RepID=G0NVM4_CAEBE|nr:hypothetical protein CAEBREN_04656 [Caenorhabditis brenneri]
MLIFCLFFLFFTASNAQNYLKMVLVYGEPTVGNGYSTHEISWEQCYSICYWDANCSVSYGGNIGFRNLIIENLESGSQAGPEKYNQCMSCAHICLKS